MNTSDRMDRLVPDKPFPPYTFVPGRFPHPISDPAGHSFGSPPEQAEQLEPEQWQESKLYLYGIDLFNHCYYWESHVAFECLWIGCGRRGSVADFLKGLIHLAAAGVKHLEGNPKGVTSHACRAAELWRATSRTAESKDAVFLGFTLAELVAVAETICQSGWPSTPPQLRVALTNTQLRLNTET